MAIQTPADLIPLRFVLFDGGVTSWVIRSMLLMATSWDIGPSRPQKIG